MQGRGADQNRVSLQFTLPRRETVDGRRGEGSAHESPALLSRVSRSRGTPVPWAGRSLPDLDEADRDRVEFERSQHQRLPPRHDEGSRSTSASSGRRRTC